MMSASISTQVTAETEARSQERGCLVIHTTARRSYLRGDHGSILDNEQYAQQVSDAILAVIRAAQTGETLAQ